MYEPTKARICDIKKLQPRKYPAPSNPINPPITGKRKRASADVATKSSVLPNGIIVRKASKSLKVFIGFIFEHIAITQPNKDIDFVVGFMDKLNGKNILVTGGAGFIGSHLCKKLSSLTQNLTIYDNLSNGKVENVKHLPKVHFVRADILDLKKLQSQEKPDLIYHLAAQVVVPYSMENPIEDFETNARGTLNVLEKARKDDARIVFASSAAVYGNTSQLPTPETHGFSPDSCYGLSKVVGEQYCNMYSRQYGLDVTIVRFANVYGPKCHGVIHDFLDKLSRNPEQLEIIGSGMQSRDFVHIYDVVDALLLCATSDVAIGETFNIGYGETITIIDLAKMILKILGLSEKTVLKPTNVPWQGDIKTIWFDISKIEKILKWTPKISLEDTLKELILERNILG